VKDELLDLLWRYWELTKDSDCSELMKSREEIEYRQVCDKLKEWE